MTASNHLKICKHDFLVELEIEQIHRTDQSRLLNAFKKRLHFG